jgi:hypothetical protein
MLSPDDVCSIHVKKHSPSLSQIQLGKKEGNLLLKSTKCPRYKVAFDSLKILSKKAGNDEV